MIDCRGRASIPLMVLIVVVFAVGPWVAAGEKPLTFEELMKFRQIRSAVVADDGSWVAYALAPYRGE